MEKIRDEAGRIGIKVPSVKDIMGKKPPEKTFRAGSVSATIWVNEGELDGKKTRYKTISFERNYLDKDGNWQKTNSLRVSDLPKGMLVLRKAYEYLVLNATEDDE